MYIMFLQRSNATLKEENASFKKLIESLEERVVKLEAKNQDLGIKQ